AMPARLEKQRCAYEYLPSSHQQEEATARCMKDFLPPPLAAILTRIRDVSEQKRYPSRAAGVSASRERFALNPRWPFFCKLIIELRRAGWKPGRLWNLFPN